MRPSIRPFPFLLAILVGCAVNYLGDWILGQRIEVFYGLQTFNFIWFLQLFVLPLLVGISVSFIYGLGGKWIALLPPLIVRFAAYYETRDLIGIPDGTALMPMGWWGFFVIVAMEVSMIGGIIGEIAIKRIYGRSDPEAGGAIELPSNVVESNVFEHGGDAESSKSKEV